MPAPVPPVSIAPWVYWNAVDSDLVLFDTRNGSYHALNDSGSLIWKQLAESGGDPLAVAAVLQARFPEATSRIAGEVEAFVRQALDLGLLVQAADTAA